MCPDFGARVSGRADLDTEICEDATINNNASQWQRIEGAFEGAYPSELAGIYAPGV